MKTKNKITAVVVLLLLVTLSATIFSFVQNGTRERTVLVRVSGFVEHDAGELNNSSSLLYNGQISIGTNPEVGDRFADVRVVFLDADRDVITTKYLGDVEVEEGKRPVHNFSIPLSERPSLVLVQFQEADTDADLRVRGSIQKSDNHTKFYTENKSEYLYSD